MLWLSRRAHARAQRANAPQSARPQALQTALSHEPDLSVGRSSFLFASAAQAPCSCLGVYFGRVRRATCSLSCWERVRVRALAAADSDFSFARRSLAMMKTRMHRARLRTLTPALSQRERESKRAQFSTK